MASPTELDWWFRDRTDGGWTIAQFPNLSLWIFIVATAARAILRPEGDLATMTTWVGRLALVWWAADEVLRGVNPWRRTLGLVVLGPLVAAAIAARMS